MNATFDFMDGDECIREVSPGVFKPRSYQQEAVDAVTQYLRDHDRCGLYMATGTGKTDVASMLMAGEWQGCMFIAPRRAIVSQTAERLALRGVPAGIEMAEISSDEVNIVASYNTLLTKSRYEKYLSRTELIIVDECHLNFTQANMRMLDHFRQGGTKIVAMTASPPEKRDMCLRDHFGEAAYVYDYQRAVNDGYLISADLFMVLMEDLDLSKFRQSFGEEFNAVAINKLMSKKSNVVQVGMTVEKYWDGKPSVVYCSGIEHATLVAEDLYTRGIECSIVHSNMSQDEVAEQMRRFMSGHVDVIVNVGILVCGWDAPHVVNLFVARPLSSRQTYTQVFGRGCRVHPGDCIAGMLTAEERRDAIAKSIKPKFNVFDLTDTSRHNDLKCALDVLRPDESPELLKRVRKRMETQKVAALDIDSILDEERRAAAAEKAERERWAMQQRQGVEVTGSVRAYQRDAMADAERNDRKRKWDPWWMPYGRFKGRSFHKIHREAPWYLKSILPHVKDKKLSGNIKVFLKKNG